MGSVGYGKVVTQVEECNGNSDNYPHMVRVYVDNGWFRKSFCWF